MTDISDAALSTSLRRQMTIAAARQVIATSNLANAETPGYKARELDFSDALTAAVIGGLKTTHVRHLQPVAGADEAAVREAADRPTKRDGNTVQLDRELLEMNRANGDFAKAQTALAAKFRLVRYAIGESR